LHAIWDGTKLNCLEWWSCLTGCFQFSTDQLVNLLLQQIRFIFFQMSITHKNHIKYF
jgi:hypothetical protein